LEEEKKIKGKARGKDDKQRRSWKMRRQADEMLEDEKKPEEEKTRKRKAGRNEDVKKQLEN
jgi:hypothetical protein